MAGLILISLIIAIIGVGCAKSMGGFVGCLDDADIRAIQEAYLADPTATEQEYVGTEHCIHGVVDDILRRPGQIAVSVNLADQIGDLIMYDQASEPENYQALTEWAEQNREGDGIRVVCMLREFVMVEDAPYPLVIPVFGGCELAE